MIHEKIADSDLQLADEIRAVLPVYLGFATVQYNFPDQVIDADAGVYRYGTGGGFLSGL